MHNFSCVDRSMWNLWQKSAIRIRGPSERWILMGYYCTVFKFQIRTAADWRNWCLVPKVSQSSRYQEESSKGILNIWSNRDGDLINLMSSPKRGYTSHRANTSDTNATTGDSQPTRSDRQNNRHFCNTNLNANASQYLPLQPLGKCLWYVSYIRDDQTIQ